MYTVSPNVSGVNDPSIRRLNAKPHRTKDRMIYVVTCFEAFNKLLSGTVAVALLYLAGTKHGRPRCSRST